MAQHDMVIDNGPGLAVRTDINAVIQALVTQNAGPVEPTTKYPGMLWLDTSSLLDGQLRQRNQANTAWITPAWAPAAIDNRYNRILNGAMQISQEWGNTALGPTGAMSSYAADQWVGSNALDGTCTQQRVQVPTPKGSANRIRLTVNTADTSLTTTQYQVWFQYIEGFRVQDFQWGTASARQVVLRFGWKSPAGTYTASFINSAGTRSYAANFTISAGQANTDTEQILVIPGDTAGTWLGDNGIGVGVRFNIGAGPTYTGAAGWSATNVMSITGSTNGLATAGNVFELFDVGLYLDLNNTGLPPPWVAPDYASEERACQRYWQKLFGMFSGNVTTSVTYYSIVNTICTMRAAPLLSGAHQGGAGFAAAAGTFNSVYPFGIFEGRVANATTNGGQFQTVVTFNARM